MDLTPSTDQLTSRFWKDEQPVVTGKARDRIRKDSLEDPRFADQYWKLDALIYRENAGTLGFNFAEHFRDPVRNLTAREMAMQRLNAPLQPVQIQRRVAPPSAFTVHQTLLGLKDLYNFMDLSIVARLVDIRQDFLDRYVRYLRYDCGHSSAVIAQKLRVVFWLYESAGMLSEDRIQFLPWAGKSTSIIADVKSSSENSTPRIPQRIMDPLLRWSIAYVEQFSRDITLLNCINDFAANHTVKLLDWDPAHRGVLFEGRLKFVIDNLSDEPEIAEQGVTTFLKMTFKRADIRLKEAAVEHNRNLPGTLFSLPSIVPEFGRPWRPPFRSGDELHLEGRNLIAACYIICAYLSGMRDSEIQAMATRPIEILRDKEGNIIRIYARSKQYKGRAVDGEPRTWIVLPLVSKAIAVMEELGMHERTEAGSLLLFTAFNRIRKGKKISLANKINRYIRDFINHINTTMAPFLGHAELTSIPIHEFRPITTKMFRRTIAWYIANRPFGIVAGMLQYGHASVQMFEGYAGAPGSGFREEIEKERSLARMADIVEMYTDDGAGSKTAGPMASVLGAEFDFIRDQIGDYPGMIVETGRRENMLAHLSKSFYPGLLADCFFDPSRAKCMEKTNSFIHDEPVRGLCDPNCENACWRRKHVSVWKVALADVERLANRNRLSPIQREILRSKKTQYKAIIDAIESADRHHAQ